MADKEIKCEVIKEFGTISKRSYNTRNGEVTEELKLRLISWNDRDPKYDVRPWEITENGEKCLKMRGLTFEELKALGELIATVKEEPKKKTASYRAKRNPTITKKVK